MPISESLYAFFDVETTGLTTGVDEVSEVATILTDLQLQEIARIEMKVKLSRHEKMRPEAAKVNGYDPAVWDVEAKPFHIWQQWLDDEICKLFGPRGHVAIGIGMNPYFDRGIIEAYYYKPSRRFFPISYHLIDVAAISLCMKHAGFINVRDVKLATVMQALGLGVQTHRAMGDCEGALAIFKKGAELMRRGGERITTAVPDALTVQVHEPDTVADTATPYIQQVFPDVKLDPVRPQAKRPEAFL